MTDTVLPLAPQRPLEQHTHNALVRSEKIWGVIFVIPMIVLVGLFIIYPILGSVRFALYNWNGLGEPSQFVGLRHFTNTVQDPYFWNAVGNNLIYTLVLVPVQLTLALVLAVILNHPNAKMRHLLRTIYFLPVVTSVTIAATAVRIILGNFSLQISSALGLNPPIDILGGPNTAMMSVIAFGIWYSLGHNLVYFMAALQTVPQELYDAAKVDGANAWQQMIYITVPVIRPLLVVIVFLATLGSINVFEQSYVLTGGGPFYASEVVAGYIYNIAFASSVARGGSSANYGRASAAAFFFSLLIFIVTLIQWYINRRMSRENEDQ